MKTIYIYDNNVEINKMNSSLIAKKNSELLAHEPINNVSSIILFGNAKLTTQAIRLCLENHVTILYCRKSGKVEGCIHSFHEAKCNKRIIQYKIYCNANKRLDSSKQIIDAKIKKQIQQIKNIRLKKAECKINLTKLKVLHNKVNLCNTINELMGIEGQAAAIYFKEYGKLIKITNFVRSKHPATDPINSLLNLTYSLMISSIMCILVSQELDASIGVLHSIKNGRPSLALDVLEFYRTDCEHFVSKLINQRQLTEKDFEITNKKCILKEKSFTKYIEQFETSIKKQQLTTIETTLHNIYPNIYCNS